MTSTVYRDPHGTSTVKFGTAVYRGYREYRPSLIPANVNLEGRLLSHSHHNGTTPEIFSDADDSLSGSIMTNSNHVLYWYLPERRHLIYNVRKRSYNRSLITKTTYLNEHDFLIRIFYKKLLLVNLLTCVIIFSS